MTMKEIRATSKRILLSLLAALCLFVSCALADTEGDFIYIESGGEAAIHGYTGNAAEVIIPASLGGYPVTSIGVCAFKNSISLTQLVIPDGVTRIRSNAFQNCTALAQIHIPDSVTQIDTHAFYGCSSLKALRLHDNIDNINILAFYGCSAIRYCSPDSLTAYVLTDVGYSFTHPDYPLLTLKAFEDASGQRTFTIADCDESAVSVSFPDHVAAIDRYAFFNCDQLTEIIVPDTVTEIAQSTFEGCSSLNRITLPGSIEKIDASAFARCFGVTIVSPPGSAAQAFAEANVENGFLWQAL